MDTALITFPVVAGIITSLVTSVITRATWSSKTKNLVAMVTGIILTIDALIFQLIPDAWPAVAGIIAGVYGVSQGIYLLLKPQLRPLNLLPLEIPILLTNLTRLSLKYSPNQIKFRSLRRLLSEMALLLVSTISSDSTKLKWNLLV